MNRTERVQFTMDSTMHYLTYGGVPCVRTKDSIIVVITDECLLDMSDDIEEELEILEENLREVTEGEDLEDPTTVTTIGRTWIFTWEI